MKYQRAPGLKSILLAILFLMLLTPAIIAEELILPDNLFFYRSVASVWGQSAVWVNPASIEPKYSGNMIMATHRQERIVRDWGGDRSRRPPRPQLS